MRCKFSLIILAGALAGSLSLQASDATLTIASFGSGISPFTGNYVNPNGIATNGIKLYCDDAADTSKGVGVQYNVTETSIASLNTSDSRYYGLAGNRNDDSWAGSYSTTLPTGTQLYDELAWLYQQMQDTSNNTILTDIQDAAWDLTNTTQLDGDHTSAAADWIKAAGSDYNTQPTSVFNDGHGNVTLSTTDYANWYVIDAASGVAGSWQEFLSDSALSSQGSPGGGGSGNAPEPATFSMLGGALLFVGVYARRKSAAR